MQKTKLICQLLGRNKMTEKELKQSFNKTNYDSVYQKNIKRIIDLLVGIIALPFFIINQT